MAEITWKSFKHFDPMGNHKSVVMQSLKWRNEKSIFEDVCRGYTAKNGRENVKNKPSTSKWLKGPNENIVILLSSSVQQLLKSDYFQMWYEYSSIKSCCKSCQFKYAICLWVTDVCLKEYSCLHKYNVFR